MTLSHPPCSPDLNLIENIWSILKRRLAELPTQATTREQLVRQVKKLWRKFDVKDLEPLYDFMRGRILDVFNQRGYPTRY